MVKLDVVDDRDLRQVMHKLRTLVEIRGVVFVALNDEIIAWGNAKAHAKVLRDATYQEGRIKFALIHHPGGDTCRRSLAVRAGDDE